jgi:hypothetical protein
MTYDYSTPYDETIKVTLHFGVYGNGNTAIQIFDVEDGTPYATATVNVPGLESDEVAIKNYSENLGMLTFLVTNKIVEPPHRTVDSGYVTIPVCKLTKNFPTNNE